MLCSSSRTSNRAWNVLDTIRDVAAELDATLAQVALRWLIDQDRFAAAVPIVGARTTEQLTENVGACGVALSGEQRARIEDARQ